MAVNINGSVDLTPIALKFFDNTYGTVYFSFLIILIVCGYVISMLLKSGIISSFTKFSEHRRKQRSKQISEQEKLLEDEFIKEYSSELDYHIKVSKLSNYLNIKNGDLDLLTYILSCRKKDRAVRLFKIGQDYLEKDEEAGLYKLKPRFTEKRISFYSGLGTTLYVLINLIGVAPFLVFQYFRFIYRHQTLTIPDGLYLNMFLFFITFFSISLMMLWKLLKPTAAKNFLEMEKISKETSKTDALDNAA